ncbi:MAG: HAMP domain-containing histidine kinase [Bacteroidetes bacterium]|uniref:histidine kinase n=1 Tax=Candidatus Gallipaludibacter merdavium TaxID=2840839 RepID=A0A9D9HUU1_9BACT|nr:HAMP domain-containing histidine kinase [Candidatus Gallipaludibacter merdavium]
MKRFLPTSDIFKYVFVAVATVIVVCSWMFTNTLVKGLEAEERRKMEIWAHATQQFISADENTDIDFVSSIIEGNTTIPVYMTDTLDNVLFVRNVAGASGDSISYNEAIQRLKQLGHRIEVNVNGETVQYIYYDDSSLLRKLAYFPYVQFSVIAFFLLVAFLAFSSIKNAEQNKVWVGLSKETAHQLGTPISSLLAWMELMKDRHVDDAHLPEMQKDVERLRVVAERFSKIGSQPTLQKGDLIPVLQNALNYMRGRASKQVTIDMKTDCESVMVNMNVPLLEWVIENLCKNAIDAMDGQGKIELEVSRDANRVYVDVTDTGKGMERSMYKKVFRPGFTTKKRGWGLGLSLTKRIVTEYHKGKIFVKSSEINVGTTFRIILPTA